MMQKLLFSLFTLLYLSATAQDNKVINDPDVSLRTLTGSFTGIIVSSGIELIISQSDQESVAVSASSDQYKERLKTEVVNGTLNIYFDRKGFSWTGGEKANLRAYVSFKMLERLQGNSGATVEVKGNARVGNLDMKFNSGSTFNGAFDAKDLSMDQSSGADVNISGSAANLAVTASSGANFKGYGLSVDYCTAKVSSGASVNITINKELTAKASSGGDVIYKGTPGKVDAHSSSGGLVKKS